MGKILIPGSSGGGVSSDDVTASKAQVLQGYKTVTTDSDDEVVDGEIVNRGNIVDTSGFENAYWDSKYLARMEQGFYSQNGPWKPCVAIPYAVMASVSGIDASKMLDTLTVAGVRGTVHTYGAWNAASEVINATWENPKKLYFRFKKGYYLDDGQYPPSVSATYRDVANAVGIRANKILDDENILGTQGAIPRWVCTTGDVITALGGEGFAWDDSYARRGRGIVMKIPNGYYIQGANWAFLPSPNLQSWNVRKDVNINGTIGTMVDYGAGGQAFRAATFDGRLLTGVANKGFILNNIGRYLNLKNINYGYQGIVDGGLKFINGYSGNTHVKTAPDIGCVFANSVNLTPFRYIKIGFKFIEFRGDGTGAQPARIELEVGATPINGAGGETYHNESNTVVRDVGGRSKFAIYTMTSTRVNVGNISDQSQQYLTLDVSASQGHHFIYIMLGNIVHEYSGGSVYAVVVVNNIEFIN